MCDRLVRLVECMRLGEFGLMMHEPLLLAGIQHRILVLILLVSIIRPRVSIGLGLRLNILLLQSGKVVLVFEIGKFSLLPNLPGQHRIVCNVDHVVRVDGPERSQTITHDGKQSNQNVVDDIDDVELFSADVDPA